MKYYLFALLFTALVYSCNNEYITETKKTEVNNKGITTSVTVTRKLRKQDRLPVAVIKHIQTNDRAAKTLDSFYYDAKGNTVLVRSFKYKNGDWQLSRSYRPQ